MASDRAIGDLIRRPTHPIFRRAGDGVFQLVVVLLGLTIIGLALALAYVLFVDGLEPLRRFGFWGFLTGTTWDPVRGVHGTWPFIVGTIITSVAALALSFLPAIGVAIFSAEYAPRWLSGIIDTIVDLLAAVPSVVVGIWGIFVLVPLMQNSVNLPFYVWAFEHAPQILPLLGPPAGYNVVTATIVLALMIVPYTSALARDRSGWCRARSGRLRARSAPRAGRSCAWLRGRRR